MMPMSRGCDLAHQSCVFDCAASIFRWCRRLMSGCWSIVIKGGLIAAMLAASLVSCALQGKVSNAQCEELFTMSYGTADNELNVIDGVQDGKVELTHSIGQIHAFHTMKDGFFYVASIGKMAELNSYGSLMYVCRGPNNAGGGEQNTVRRTFKYPIMGVNGIAVDSKKRVYVVCTMPEDERKTADNGLVLSWVLLRMSRDAAKDDYIGRQGAGGEPFAYIRSVNITKDDEVVAVCQSMEGDGIQAWYYSPDGKNTGCVTVPLTLAIDILDASKKKEAETEGGQSITCHVREVIPDRQSRTALICADTYEGQEYDKTYIIKMDVKSGNYGESIEIPPYNRIVEEDFGKVSYKMPYDFLGVADNGEMFFAVATDDGFAVQTVSSDGRHIALRNLHARRKDCVYHTLSVSDSGIISAIMARKDEATFMWWNAWEQK